MDDVSPPLAQNRYRLVEILGEGGMAVVYRAYDERLQVYRAIKVLSTKLVRHALIQKRFETEARTMARLHHPNIVGVHDIGQEGDRSFIVMELVEGGSLMDYVNEHGPMHPRLACEAVLALLAALGVAHDAGVVHRDIKPQNVLLSKKGRAKVTDFGIAHVADDSDDRSLTKTGSVMGTWGFMAPEQRVSARKVDGRSDLYAVGATLYTLLTTQLPVDLFAAEMDDTVLEGVEPNLAAVIRRATRYRPDDRYADVQEMEDALRQVRPELPPLTDDVPSLAGRAMDLRATPPPLETRDATSMTMVPPGEFVAEHTSARAREGQGALTDPRGTNPAAHTMNLFDEETGSAPLPVDAPVEPPTGTLHDGPPTRDEWKTVDEADYEPPADRRPWMLAAVLLLGVLGVGAWAMGRDPDVARDVEPEVVEPAVVEPAGLDAEPEVVEPEVVQAEVVEPEVLEVEVPERGPTSSPGTEVPPEPAVVEVEPDPEPEPEPEPEEVQPAPTGRVSVAGDAAVVTLISASGARLAPDGPVPAGTYTVEASFGAEPHIAMRGLQVPAGGTVSLTCYGAFGTCKGG